MENLSNQAGNPEEKNKQDSLIEKVGNAPLPPMGNVKEPKTSDGIVDGGGGNAPLPPMGNEKEPDTPDGVVDEGGGNAPLPSMENEKEPDTSDGVVNGENGTGDEPKKTRQQVVTITFPKSFRTAAEQYNAHVMDVDVANVVKYPGYERLLSAYEIEIDGLVKSSLDLYGQVALPYAFFKDGVYYVFDGSKILEAFKKEGKDKISVVVFDIDEVELPALKMLLDWDKPSTYRTKADNFMSLKEHFRQHVLEHKGESTTRQMLATALRMSEKYVSMFEAILVSEDAQDLVEALDAKLETINSAYKIVTGSNGPKEAKEPTGKGTCKLGDNPTRTQPYDFCTGCPLLKEQLRLYHLANVDRDMPLDDEDVDIKNANGKNPDDLSGTTIGEGGSHD